jgi:hypothetical protein
MRPSPRRAALLALGLAVLGLWQLLHAREQQPQRPQQPHWQQQPPPPPPPPQGQGTAAAASAAGARGRAELLQGELLHEGEHLVSPHGRFFLGVEGGVATARQGTPGGPAPGPPLWDSSSRGPARPARRGAHALILQADGAVAVVSDGGTTAPSLVWSSPGDRSAARRADADPSAPMRYQLRLEDGGGDGRASWSAAVFRVPEPAGQARGADLSQGAMVQQLFSLTQPPGDHQPAPSPAAQEGSGPDAAAAPARVVGSSGAAGGAPVEFAAARPSGPGHECFRRGARSAECVQPRAGPCADAACAPAASRSLWDAQALCSRRSNCSGVARLASSAPADSSSMLAHSHPKHVFTLCDATMPGDHEGTSVEAESAWLKTTCDAEDSNAVALLDRLHLVMTVKTSAKVHNTRVQ